MLASTMPGAIESRMDTGTRTRMAFTRQDTYNLNRSQDMFGSIGGRPIGLEGGEFVVNPQATKDNLALLKAINASAHFDEGGRYPVVVAKAPSSPSPSAPARESVSVVVRWGWPSRVPR